MKLTSLFGAAALLLQQSIAHPGQSAEDHAQEVAERNEYLSNNRRSLAHCADTLKARGNDVAMHARRSAMVEKLRAERAINTEERLMKAIERSYLRARDLNASLATSHESNMTGITVDTDPSILFAGNNSCILSPEVTQGPYWVQGELIRSNITETQVGVPLTLDIQVVDVNTCEPVPQVFLEIWHCNSTGVYGGVVASGNGNANDTTNLDNTSLRGIQQSDEEGVVVFQTIFPGHYIGRTLHIHVISHNNATVNPNSTLSGGSITHVGQMYFDQDLISLVETQEPYVSNTQELTTNADDMFLPGSATTVDPFVEYVLLGDDISEGLFGWLAFGMDSTNSFMNITPKAYLTENGGVTNENAVGPMFGNDPSQLSSGADASSTPTPSTAVSSESVPSASGGHPFGGHPSGIHPSTT
ncbi:aromatic compound dioxygenase [Clathrospora elynae]|uniref:Aromatic compound dioxygenase n=1 Tax=Clathrospora elynae TaxID=706981 RepID=A0A6A5SMY1_9PLEO|nr:aromatic compound dioxygenase [Clathrospora elynae]